MVAIANARAIPANLNGLIEKRQFRSTNSQSSSSSFGVSSGSEVTSDGISRTAVYSGTPHTITQRSHSLPDIGQGETGSSFQTSQNPPQIIQDPFPQVSAPFQTTQLASESTQSIGMPVLPIALPIVTLSMSIPPPSITIDPLGTSTPAATFTQTIPVAPSNPSSIPASTNAAQGTSPPPRPSKAVLSNLLSNPNAVETANQLRRPPSQLLETSNRVSKPSNRFPQDPDDTEPETSNPTKSPSNSSTTQTSTHKGHATKASPVHSFPVFGMPVGPHAQELISTKSTAENLNPDQELGHPPTINLPSQTSHPQNSNVPMQVGPPQNNDPTTQAPTIGLSIAPVSQAQRPSTHVLAPSSPPAGTATGPFNEARLETGLIPIVIESYDPEGLPFRSDGLLMISNIVPMA
ncbi:hypothetical protein PGT21_011409 [Puccinia graminis f. sp. tritici]|uniref:Uncharacterized protein n=1 Tax=Puccinia graminis f. sp. tritici TaxID=56615 RepID=A0A5B0S3Q0_PUCGR|nr:hypothetical protein PGT21_011409 [Puccinia graminis f. sp. tritici]KAA1132149.1 hypothetical protein PGTUg99_037478 [Puccinia graminis f. sp. tritici]